jgi:glycosyltransferase involved in cell wall biosynthesis
MAIPKLSICIATYNRGKFIGETLDSIITQLDFRVEIVVVDGASPDNTQEVMSQYLSLYPDIRYYREQMNSGVDADYDKAVGYAKGEYCWLMTDDDLISPLAVARVLESIEDSPELIVVNSEVRNVNFSKVYVERSLAITEDRKYAAKDGEKFFAEIAAYLSFIGGVVIKRQTWLKRNRADYYGTLFIHVGVIFQHPPINKVKVIANPLITIRYGNGMWSARSFEIWTFRWPKLIWSFADFSDTSKLQVTQREPRKSISRLIRNRALGAFTHNDVQRLWPASAGKGNLLIAYILSIFPASLANFLSVFYLSFSANSNQMALHDLLHSKHAGMPSRMMAQVLKTDIHKF